MALSPPRIEGYFYSDLPGLRDLSIDEGGGDVKLTLTTARTVTAALQEWEDLANAHGSLSGTYDFQYSDEDKQVHLRRLDGAPDNFAVTFEAGGSLHTALGYSASSYSGANIYSSDLTTKHICNPAGIEYSAPQAIEDVQLDVSRWGRAKAYSHYKGRVIEITILFTDGDVAEDIADGPLFSSRFRAHCSTDEASAYSRTNLDGYLDVLPYEVGDVERDGVGAAHAIVPVMGILDDGDALATTNATGFASIAAGLPYGYTFDFCFEVEGWQYHLVESDRGATDETGFTQDPSLIIGKSAKIGSTLGQRRTGIGQGHDLKVVIERNAITKTLFDRPSIATKLVADLDYTDTEAKIDDASVWPSSGTFDQATERIGYSGRDTVSTPNELTGLSRGSPNGTFRAYNHPVSSGVSTYLTDTPLVHKGRIVTLYAVPVDPYGAPVGATLLANAAKIWLGKIHGKPKGHRRGWSLRCRSMERYLTDKIGATVSGSARWQFHPDPRVVVDPEWTLRVKMDWPTDADEEFDIQPFSAYSPGVEQHLSTLRRDIKTAWAAGVPSNLKIDGDLMWVRQEDQASLGGKISVTWQMKWLGSGDGTNERQVYTHTTITGGNIEGLTTFGLKRYGEGDTFGLPTQPTHAFIGTHLYSAAADSLNTLVVKLDKGDPTLLPTTGWVILEVGDRELTYEYASVHILDDSLILRGVRGPSVESFAADVLDDVFSEFGCRFAFRDSGALVDTMRRMIMSSGRAGDNDATYDTLPEGSGYDIAEVDTASFDEHLDGFWLGLVGTMLVDERISWTDMYGKLLALSGRALVLKPDANGDMKLGIVRSTVANTAEATLTIRDIDLVDDGGSTPVRHADDPPDVNAVSVKVIDPRGQAQSPINLIDKNAMARETPSRFNVTVHGMERADFVDAAAGWAESLFGARLEGPPYEIDVVPWLAHSDGTPIAVGDVALWSTTHYEVWNQETGDPGYVGPVRILGVQIKPATGIMTLLIMPVGIFTPFALSPSAPVDSFTGTPGIGDTIRLASDYFVLFNAYLTASDPFTVTVYLPGADAATDGYTIDDVQLVSGKTELTVASVIGSPSLSTSWYVTLPDSSVGNVAQNRHLHADTSGAVWQ